MIERFKNSVHFINITFDVFWINHCGEPTHTNQTIGSGRTIHPAERCIWSSIKLCYPVPLLTKRSLDCSEYLLFAEFPLLSAFGSPFTNDHIWFHARSCSAEIWTRDPSPSSRSATLVTLTASRDLCMLRSSRCSFQENPLPLPKYTLTFVFRYPQVKANIRKYLWIPVSSSAWSFLREKCTHKPTRRIIEFVIHCNKTSGILRLFR